MRYEHFYSELGKLLYAVADVDGVISREEKETLLSMVKDELAPKEKHVDKFGTDVAFYTEIEFELLEDQVMDAQTAFNSFIDYVEEHHTGIDETMRRTAIKLAEKLAGAYKGKSKKEQELLTVLKKKLKALK